ncbi:MAG: AAA family ATPase [Acidimicrobiales bacterium]
MRCTRIEFEGYKRLARTGCSVDGQIIAFVGLNEVGKSSLLEALVWLTADEEVALPVASMNRSHRVEEDDRVVWAQYDLDADDVAVIADLDFAEMPRPFILERHRNGAAAYGFTPSPKRDPRPFDTARARLVSVRKRLEFQFAARLDSDDEDSLTAGDWATQVDDGLAAPDRNWEDPTTQAARQLIEWLKDAAPTSRKGNPRDARAAAALEAVYEIATSDHPSDIGRHRMIDRVPKFVLFEERDRELGTVHAIEEQTQRAAPQRSLRNLLKIADLDLNRLWTYIETADDSNQESYIEEANANLLEFYSQAWNQANVAVRFKVNAQNLEVRLKEFDRKGAVTNIEERSDGLRTFIALSAFLAAKHLAVPPVLLIDEAETHLHYDAQADLVGVLLKNVEATQVFYTTHSPGCLPSDLGTSIRLLSRDRQQQDASKLKADFWTNQEPGFAPLLYAMGASAAAFSVCRRAVLAEGAADMILLPTLIRAATGKSDLDYQIAPGLSNAHAYGMNVEEIAAKVVYLHDGDPGGDKHKKALLAAGVDQSRIFRLPNGAATEDLIDRGQYIEVVNGMLGTAGIVTSGDLKDGQPIAKSLQDWGRRAHVKIPGHVAVAYGILRLNHELRLTAPAKRSLIRLDAQFTAAFGHPVAS